MFGSKKKRERQRAENAQKTIEELAKAGAFGKDSGLSQEELEFLVAEGSGGLSARDKKILKKQERQEEKTKRVEDRDQTKDVAYEHGFDPGRDMWQGISGSLGAIAQGATGIAMAGAMGSIGSAMAQNRGGEDSSPNQLVTRDSLRSVEDSPNSFSEGQNVAEGNAFGNVGNALRSSLFNKMPTTQTNTSLDSLLEGSHVSAANSSDNTNKSWIGILVIGIIATVVFFLTRKKGL